VTISTTESRTILDLSALSEAELLNCRICDLLLTINGSWLEPCIHELYAELSSRGLVFHPTCYLADEWLTPKDEPVIGIPFYLAHPALIKLEKKMMLEAEGSTEAWCLKLLRHETGHALSYAYRLLDRRKWRTIFGSPSQEYPDTYRFRPYSKNYVRHLDGFYAQYHPEEDFVETFAVWLTPGLDWRKQYAGWKALEKLQYVDELMASLKGKPPLSARGKQHWHLKTLKMTLANFYKKRRELSAEFFPDFHDDNLRRIFTVTASPELFVIAADRMIKRYQKAILNQVSLWTGERQYIIHELLATISKRCRELKLLVREPEPTCLAALTSYLTTLVMNYTYTGWYRGDKRKRKMP